MMDQTRRGFLKRLGALGAGAGAVVAAPLVAEKIKEVLVEVPVETIIEKEVPGPETIVPTGGILVVANGAMTFRDPKTNRWRIVDRYRPSTQTTQAEYEEQLHQVEAKLASDKPLPVPEPEYEIAHLRGRTIRRKVRPTVDAIRGSLGLDA